METKFLNNLNYENLVEKADRILLAVSGGIDSVAMLHLFEQTEINYAIAHCNFQLRGNDAISDQHFVNDLAKSLNREFFTINFDTDVYAKNKGISIQMAARDLRYNWFNEIAEKHNFNKIATAHNKDDIVETFLLNLTRGTGIKGLTGISAVNGKIIRPMLFATRNEITEYIKKNNFQYREDSSNAETKYKRNLIRHRIIPHFREMNPSFTETIIKETVIFQAVNQIYQNQLEVIKKSVLQYDENRILVDIPAFQNLDAGIPILYDLLEPYGFTSSDIHEIYQAMNSQPGKKFYSKTHFLLKDRNKFIIEPLNVVDDNEEFLIDTPEGIIDLPIGMKYSIIVNSSGFKIPIDQHSVALDYDKFSFPLKLRHWQDGDYFYPLGIKGRKKLSDFFTDRKIPMNEKNKIWLLIDGEQILWIIGYQIDDRFKITPQTKNILLIERIG